MVKQNTGAIGRAFPTTPLPENPPAVGASGRPPSAPPDQRFIDTKELAELLVVSPWTIERGRKSSRKRQWPPYTKVSGAVKYWLPYVYAWLMSVRIVPHNGIDIPMHLSGPFIDRKELAKILDRSLSWLEKSTDAYDERLPPGYRIGRAWRYSRPEVMAWVEATYARKDPRSN